MKQHSNVRTHDAAFAVAADARWRMLSQTAQYALRVVLHLACRPASARSTSAELAAELHIPEPYLARVLNALAHAGTLRSTRGPRGGFRLARPAEVPLAEVVAPFDAVGDPPQCLLRNQRCGAGASCVAHADWHDVAAGVRSFFQRTTVADLLHGETSAA